MKQPKSVRAIGILNAYGEFWTSRTFQTGEEAENYMKLFWGRMKNPPDMSKHQIIPVRVSAILPPTPKKLK